MIEQMFFMRNNQLPNPYSRITFDVKRG